MTEIRDNFELSECHSHVFRPFQQSPLSSRRILAPAKSPREEIEEVWRTSELDHAVLIEASALVDDHAAPLATPPGSPTNRRGVVHLVLGDFYAILAVPHQRGRGAVRCNWIVSLLASNGDSGRHRFAHATALPRRIGALGCHLYFQTDIVDQDLVTRLDAHHKTPVVIDYMDSPPQALADDSFWVEASGADRLTEEASNVVQVVQSVRSLLDAATSRRFLGLDWAPVNSAIKRCAVSLADLMIQLAGNGKTLERVLFCKPAQLYSLGLEVA